MYKFQWIAVIAGHALERYEVTLFSYFSPMLMSMFFPIEDDNLSLIIGMATFAAGY